MCDRNCLDEGAKNICPTHCQHLLVHVHWLSPSFHDVMLESSMGLILILIIMMMTIIIIHIMFTKSFCNGSGINDGNDGNNDQGKAESEAECNHDYVRDNSSFLNNHDDDQNLLIMVPKEVCSSSPAISVPFPPNEPPIPN